MVILVVIILSSAGTISKVFSPLTTNTEAQRKVGGAIQSTQSVYDQPTRVAGIVTKVHPKKPRLVKARHAFNNTPLANDRWIELNHSAQEIIERWGTIRVGFRIRATLSGPSGVGADATVISTELQAINEPTQVNEATRGLWSIFTPGSSI